MNKVEEKVVLTLLNPEAERLWAIRRVRYFGRSLFSRETTKSGGGNWATTSAYTFLGCVPSTGSFSILTRNIKIKLVTLKRLTTCVLRNLIMERNCCFPSVVSYHQNSILITRPSELIACCSCDNIILYRDTLCVFVFVPIENLKRKSQCVV
jgi:hypothetical protein